jgi:GNAT superfamily N-acetyltransferase
VRRVDIRDATAERWSDLDVVMRGPGDPGRCWCQFFRLTNVGWQTTRTADRRAVLAEQAARSPAPGVLGYVDGEPVGWCAVAPRADYPRLASTRVAQATQDGPGVWAVTCFVVRVGHRRAGVAGQLLEGAVDLARRNGARVVEGYPVDVAVKAKPSASELYHGALSTFLRAGFTEVARRGPARAVVRLSL